jgi:hypothetical protein
MLLVQSLKYLSSSAYIDIVSRIAPFDVHENGACD